MVPLHKARARPRRGRTEGRILQRRSPHLPRRPRTADRSPPAIPLVKQLAKLAATTGTRVEAPPPRHTQRRPGWVAHLTARPAVPPPATPAPRTSCSRTRPRIALRATRWLAPGAPPPARRGPPPVRGRPGEGAAGVTVVSPQDRLLMRSSLGEQQVIVRPAARLLPPLRPRGASPSRAAPLRAILVRLLEGVGPAPPPRQAPPAPAVRTGSELLRRRSLPGSYFQVCDKRQCLICLNLTCYLLTM